MAEIKINVCKLRDKGSGTNDLRVVQRHEIYHASGYRHYEGSAKTNAAYYSHYRITGR
jgi:hypothetical protein